MILSTVLCTLIVLHSTTATVQWKSCFDDSCPIKNLKFSSEMSSEYDKALSDGKLKGFSTFNDNTINYEMGFTESSDRDRLIGIAWEEKTLYVLYTCGPAAKESASYIYPEIINGTKIYINGKEYCSWSLEINNSPFPFELIDPPQYYISDRGYQIYYSLNQTVPVPTANYSQLPESVEPFVEGYQYKAVGSEKYLFIAREANQTTDFLLKVNGETPRLVEVNLNNTISIDIECNFNEKTLNAYTKYCEAKNNLWKDIRGVKINGSECRWSLPYSFDGFYGQVDLKETDYELQIIENNMFVYFDEPNFRVATPTSASSSLTIAKSLLISLLFSIWFSS